MKQHISLEQQNELSDQAYQKLLRWCLKREWKHEEIVWGRHDGECRGGANLSEYLLTIGQMIEFLEFGREDELCDALWEAVKEKLK